MSISAGPIAKGIVTAAGMVSTSMLKEMRRMLRRQMVRDAAFLAASQYVVGGLHFLLTVAAARLLGPADYGSAALVMAYPALILSLIDFKSKEITTRYIASFHAAGCKEELSSICRLGYLVDVLGGFAAFLLVSITFWWIAQHILNMPGMTWVAVAYAATFPILALRKTSGAILASWQCFGQLAGCQILTEGMTVAVVLALLVARLGVPGLILGMALGHVIVGVTMLGIASHVLRREGLGPWWRSPLGAIAPLRKELTAFFGWNYLMVTLNGTVTQVPLMLLGRLHSHEEAGFYRLAMSLMTAGSYLETTLVRVTYPVLSARWGVGERQSLSETLRHWTLRGGLPGGALLILMIPLLPLAVPVVFGPAYTPMVGGAQVMLLAAAVSTVFFWLRSFYYAIGKINLWTKAYSLYTALVVGLGWWCVQGWGFAGLANLMAAGTILFTVSMMVVYMTAWERWK
jgi:O-antigen/teichoic acid export membrane protein